MFKDVKSVIPQGCFGLFAFDNLQVKWVTSKAIDVKTKNITVVTRAEAIYMENAILEQMQQESRYSFRKLMVPANLEPIKVPNNSSQALKIHPKS